MKSYGVIIASHRSGTTLLSGALGSKNKIPDYAEVFRWNYEGEWRDERISSDPDRELIVPNQPPIFDEDTCVEIHQQVISLSPNRHFLFKALIQQAPYYYHRLWRNICNDTNSRMIFIKRNPLEMCVSVNAATRTQCFHVDTKGRMEYVEPPKMFLDKWQILQFFLYLKAAYEFFDYVLNKRPGRSMLLEYDDMNENWDETYGKVREFLDWEELPEHGRRKYNKIITGKHSDLIDNYDDIKQFFRGSQWEYLFDD
jgi:LPS sulfotransferase NodH